MHLTDPEFSSKNAEIIGLYLGSPENAVVFSVEKTPCGQALERAQGWLKMPDDRAFIGFAHEYKRNGTTNRFAALEVVTVRVLADCLLSKRRDDFLGFLDRLVPEKPAKELHF